MLEDPRQKKNALSLLHLLRHLKSVEKYLTEGKILYQLIQNIGNHYYHEEKTFYGRTLDDISRELYQCRQKIDHILQNMPNKLLGDKSARQAKFDSGSGNLHSESLERFEASLSCFNEYNLEISSRLAKLAQRIEEKYKIKPIKQLIRQR